MGLLSPNGVRKHKTTTLRQLTIICLDFHTNENTRQSHISCQRWWLWTTVTGDGVTQLQSGQGRRFAGVHGSTPYHRLATSAVSVALAKAAQAGFPRRGGRARASLGAALDAGRTTSNVIQDIDVLDDVGCSMRSLDAQSQRYCARGSRARLGAALGGVWR